RQLTADGQLTVGVHSCERAKRRRQPARRLERDRRPGPPSQFLPDPTQRLLAPWQETEELIALGGETARDEGGIDSGRTRQNRHGHTGFERGGDEPSAGVGDARPITPAAVPSSERTIWTRPRAGGSASRRIVSRAGSSRKSPAEAKPPPMTTSWGLKMFTKLPMAAPSFRPISSRISTAVESPSAASRTSRCASTAGPNASCASFAAAVPLTYASRCPRPVHVPWQGIPS